MTDPAAQHNRFRNFDTEDTEEDTGGPITFRAGNLDWTCISKIPVGVLYDLSKGDNAIVLEMDYILNVLVDEDVQRWNDESRRRGTTLDPGKMDKIFSWIAERYAGRPLENPDSSPAGSSNGQTGTNLTLISSSTPVEPSPDSPSVGP